MHRHRLNSSTQVKTPLPIDHCTIANGYSEDFILKVDSQSRTNTTNEPITYMKIPYVSEKQKRKITQLSRRTKMDDKIRLVFQTERPLAWSFREKRESQKCPDQCISCRTASKPDLCFTKFCVHRVACKFCNSEYVGQSSRCIRTRIIEHSKSPSSFVFLHMTQHPNHLNFIWSILGVVRDDRSRLALEALYIHSLVKPMNGCHGKDIRPVLL